MTRAAILWTETASVYERGKAEGPRIGGPSPSVSGLTALRACR
jgi:hypothetical protein